MEAESGRGACHRAAQPRRALRFFETLAFLPLLTFALRTDEPPENTARQAGLSCALLALRHAPVRPGSGMNSPHNRMASPVQASRCAWVPCAIAGVAVQARPKIRPSPASESERRWNDTLFMFSPCLRVGSCLMVKQRNHEGTLLAQSTRARTSFTPSVQRHPPVSAEGEDGKVSPLGQITLNTCSRWEVPRPGIA